MRSLLTFRWAGVLAEATGYLSAAALLAATGVTLHAVITRYFLGLPTVWQMEVTIYLMMIVAFVGAAYGLKHHAHVGVDLVVEQFRPRGRLVLRTITAVLCLAVVLVVLWTSFQLWHEAYEGGFRSSTAWRAPLAVVYTILPIGMFLVALQYIAMIIEAVLGLAGKVPLSQVALMGASNEAAAIEREAMGAPDADGKATDGAGGGPGIDDEGDRR